MDKDRITMSRKELNRLKIIEKVISGDITQVKAAEVLGITDRHVRRVVMRVKEEGPGGMAHRSRGRDSPRRMAKDLEDQIAQLIEERYADFGPTFASEKLWEREGIRVGREKLRQIMIHRGLWRVRRKKRRAHHWRERKAYYGEMVQMDGSHHDWLEGRGPEIVFMGYVDDATGRAYGRFYDYEGLYPAMDSLEGYIRLYGLPVSLYVDKHSTYKTSREPSLDELLRGQEAETQFERACRELSIQVIHAHSPQAKGRIERSFATLQDRLIKEMRLEGIETKEEANEFLKTYLPLYNKRFGKEPFKQGNLHRRLPRGVRFNDIFCIKAQRVITNGYTVKWKSREYLIDNPTIAIRRRKVEVREYFDGKMAIRLNGRYLKFSEIAKRKAQKERKQLTTKPVERRRKYTPPPDHPWKRNQPSFHHNYYLERVI
jgi:hypothetical protein